MKIEDLQLAQELAAKRKGLLDLAKVAPLGALNFTIAFEGQVYDVRRFLESGPVRGFLIEACTGEAQKLEAKLQGLGISTEEPA